MPSSPCGRQPLARTLLFAGTGCERAAGQQGAIGTGIRANTGQAPEAREALAGLVERVTFHSPENGFCVLRVKARGQRDLVTVVGHAALISAGEFVQASGTWVTDRTRHCQLVP
jgi:exodeoxyribonuclease V alpha subunit